MYIYINRLAVVINKFVHPQSILSLFNTRSEELARLFSYIYIYSATKKSEKKSGSQ